MTMINMLSKKVMDATCPFIMDVLWLMWIWSNDCTCMSSYVTTYSSLIKGTSMSHFTFLAQQCGILAIICFHGKGNHIHGNIYGVVCNHGNPIWHGICWEMISSPIMLACLMFISLWSTLISAHTNLTSYVREQTLAHQQCGFLCLLSPQPIQSALFN